MSGMSATKALINNINPSHVSSSGYYGYVPPIVGFSKSPIHSSDSLGENSSVCVPNYHNSSESALEGSLHRLHENYYSTMSMEMETDEHCSGMGMCCQNNHYVIPEMVDGGKAMLMGGGEGMSLHRLNGNRKRNCEHGGELDGRETLMKRFKGEAVVTAAVTMVPEIPERLDHHRCTMTRHHYM